MDHPLSVLVVDDDWAEVWCLLLAQWGHRSILAYDAAAALAVARTERPDLALLDVGLPGTDTWELARRLRGDPALRGIQLIAVTSHADADQAKIAGGIHWHLVRPVDPDCLRRLLAVCGARRGLRAEAEAEDSRAIEEMVAPALPAAPASDASSSPPPSSPSGGHFPPETLL
jgi:CheY-like chemotaxis protein